MNHGSSLVIVVLGLVHQLLSPRFPVRETLCFDLDPRSMPHMA